MGRLNSNAVSTVIFVCVAIVAIGLVASTIGTVEGVDIDVGGDRAPGQQDSGGSDDPATVDEDQGDGNASLEQRDYIDLQMCVSFLATGPAILGIIGGVIGVLYLTYRRYNLASSGLFGTFLIPVVMLAYFLLTNCNNASPGGSGGLPNGGDVVGSPGSTGIAAPESPLIVALVFGGVVLLAAVMMVTMTREDEQFDPVEEEASPDADAADFARAAGRAADRIEETNVSVDNAVYRAWLEMTGLLQIDDPDTAAPRTFAEEAIAVGLAEDDVRTLTELFNEVRYGGRDPDARESDAIETLRNIENTYEASDDESSGDTAATSTEDDR